nr:ARF19 [Lilium hybrid cultivar]
MDASPPSPPEPRLVDPQVWKACAGSASQIPVAGTTVYYFPQGHAEQATAAPDFSSMPVRDRAPFHLCNISSVRLLADEATDEVFAKFLLDPRPAPAPSAEQPAAADDSLLSFPKVLTPSDANNGGGFSVPRYCADSIFPPLDFTLDPPFQNITIHDMHGTPWKFRHIYRGTPRRHLLTTGWSKFVNSKKLVAGDSVVFMKNKAGELLVGIRRALRYFGGCPYGLAEEMTRPEVVRKDGFSRNVKGRVPPEAVLKAVRLAEAGNPFEVVYYPRTGLPDFVVDAEMIEAATRVRWVDGTRIKMWVEAEDVSTMTQGKVCGMAVLDPVLWPNSPWRMLQVKLDEPKATLTRNVNPWQVELASTTFHLQSSYPPLKRLKASPTLEQPTNIYYPVAGFNSLVVAELAPPLFNYNTPVGIQGARQNSSSESNVTTLVPVFKTVDNSVSNSSSVKTSKQANNISAEFSVGSTSQSDTSSPRTQSNSSREKQRFVKIFGQFIPLDQHSNSDVGKENKEVQAEVDRPSTNHPQKKD